MGTTAMILMNQDQFTPERVLSDTIVAVYHAKLSLQLHQYQKKTSQSSTGLRIYSALKEGEGNNSFQFYIHAKENPFITFEYYDEIKLDPKLNLCNAGYIEEVFGSQKLIFHFIYEYLKINQDHYFWLPDYDWVYCWEDMERLRSQPYDPDWCYKDPRVS